jgi:hypothetical protein
VHPDARIICATGDPHLPSALDQKIGPVFSAPTEFIELLTEIARQLAS